MTTADDLFNKFDEIFGDLNALSEQEENLYQGWGGDPQTEPNSDYLDNEIHQVDLKVDALVVDLEAHKGFMDGDWSSQILYSLKTMDFRNSVEDITNEFSSTFDDFVEAYQEGLIKDDASS